MIKKIIILVAVVAVTILLLHIAFFMFINAKGKDIIIGGIERNFSAQASMGSLSVRFPFNLEIKDFKCQDVSFKKANISLGLFNPFIPKLILNKVYIDGLDVKITKEKENIYIEPFMSKEKTRIKKEKPKRIPSQEVKEPVAKDVETVKGKPSKVKFPQPKGSQKKLSFVVKKLYFKNSTIRLSYFFKPKRSLDISLEDLKLTLRNFTYPKLAKFNIKVEASLRTDQGLSKDLLHIDGWIDYLNKNMDVDVDLKSFDYSVLSKYYPSFWRPVNLGIEEAKISLETNLNSKENDLVINGVLSLDKIDYVEQEDFPRRDLIRTAIALIQGNKEKPTIRFKLKTKMDSPQLSLSSLQESLAESIPLGPGLIIEGVLGRTREVLTEGAVDIEDIAESAVDTAIGVIKDVVGSFSDIFKSKKEPPQDTPEETEK